MDICWSEFPRLPTTDFLSLMFPPVQVKEPQPIEWPLIRPGQIIFAYFHFSADQTLTEAMLRSKAVCLAYETVQVAGRLPLLEPMSEVAGKMSIQCGMHFLETSFGGSGVLLGGVPGVRRGRVLIIGGGVVGAAAATVAAGLRADVVVLDNNVDRLKCLESVLPPNVSTRLSSEAALLQELPLCDLLIGAVLLPGGRRAPKLVKREHLKLMKAGSVIVDVAVDQGGCVETTHPTTHENPVHVVDGIIHYGVTNMPGAVAQTSTMALSNATLQYILQIAGAGWQEACRANPALLCGLNVAGGKIFLTGIAEAFDWKLSPEEELREVLHQMLHVPGRSPFQAVQRQHAQPLERKQLLRAKSQKMHQKAEGTESQRKAIAARSVGTLRGRKGRQQANHVLARTTPRTQLRSK